MENSVEKNEKSSNEHDSDIIIIIVDGTNHSIKKGHHSVTFIKSHVGISQADKLVHVIEEELKHLKDEEMILIECTQIFRVAPGGGKSS